MIRKGHNISDTVFIVVSLRSFSGLASDECSLWKGLEVELRDVPALCNERVRALRAATGWPEPGGGARDRPESGRDLVPHFLEHLAQRGDRKHPLCKLAQRGVDADLGLNRGEGFIPPKWSCRHSRHSCSQLCSEWGRARRRHCRRALHRVEDVTNAAVIAVQYGAEIAELAISCVVAINVDVVNKNRCSGQPHVSRHVIKTV